MSDYDWSVEVEPQARAAISRELKEWDGREMCGALVGHIDGGKVVITNAGGLGVETKRDQHSVRPSFAQHFDFANACRAELCGGWHSHSGEHSSEASDQDIVLWERVRRVLEAPVYVGLIFTPRWVSVRGIALVEEGWSFRNPDVAEYLTTDAGCHRTRFTLRGEDIHDPSVY